MSRSAGLALDAATGQTQGRRALQEDAVMADVAAGAAHGLIALADGCGGHARGDLASNIAATVALRAFGRNTGTVPERLREAADAANLAVYARAEGAPDLEGMGTTLLLIQIADGCLHWASVGDSPLYLLRDGALQRLNAVHSLAHHLDLLVGIGEMTEEEAALHPARSCLTSALGGPEIEEIDCPADPTVLRAGDLVIAASDGLLTLTDQEIAGALTADTSAPADRLVSRLLGEIAALDAEGQDNASVACIRVDSAAAATDPWPALPKLGKHRALGLLADAMRATSRAAPSRADADARDG